MWQLTSRQIAENNLQILKKNISISAMNFDIIQVKLPSPTTMKVSEGKRRNQNNYKCMNLFSLQKYFWNFMVVAWLRLFSPNAGSSGLTPGQGTRSHMMQLKKKKKKRILHSATKIPHAAMKILCPTTRTQHSHNIEHQNIHTPKSII